MVKGLSPAEEDREMEKRLISDKGSLNYLDMMSCEVRQLAQTWRSTLIIMTFSITTLSVMIFSIMVEC